MSSGVDVQVSALAINVPIPEALRWTDSRRGQEFELTTLNVRLLRDDPFVVIAVGEVRLVAIGGVGEPGLPGPMAGAAGCQFFSLCLCVSVANPCTSNSS